MSKSTKLACVKFCCRFFVLLFYLGLEVNFIFSEISSKFLKLELVIFMYTVCCFFRKALAILISMFADEHYYFD